MKKESVWDYPRPPRFEPVTQHLRVKVSGKIIADTNQGYRMLETSHPPVYYFPIEDVKQEYLKPSGHQTFCEFKGKASYYDLNIEGKTISKAAWYYPTASERYPELKNKIAFYPSKMDECWIGDEKATAQEGDFYGGWITSNLEGPFKGGPGTWGW